MVDGEHSRSSRSSEVEERDAELTADASARLATLSARLGLTFRDPRLFLQATIHRSAVLERERDGRPAFGIASNERLEFLGDAVLNMLVAHYAYLRFPEHDEGQLTEVRTALVRRSTLALLAESLDIGDVVYMSREGRRRESRGRATVLAEAFEALVAAIFLDQGLETTAHFVYALLDEQLAALLERSGALNAKSRLQELAQVHLRVLPRYALLERHGPDHDSRFVVEARVGEDMARGEGASRQAAEQDAARTLLERLAPLYSLDLQAESVERAALGLEQ